MDDKFIEARESERKVYELLMSEVKARVFGIDVLLTRCREMHPQIVQEICDLQVRLCCECIALACLAAHGNMPEANTPDLFRAYQPGKIISRLRKLHPDFYPRIIVPQSRPDGWHMEADPAGDASFLSRDALIDLWNTLGERLHKGDLKSLLSGKRTIATDHPNASALTAGLRRLLQFHTVHSRDATHAFICEGFMDQPGIDVRCSLGIAQDLR